MSDVTLSTPGAASRQDTTRRVGRYARYVFWLMFIINFLNYLDRWIFTGLSAVIQQDLRIDDFQIGLLTSGFLIVYTIVALPLGFLAERVARKIIVGVGVAIWSVATVLTGVVGGFLALLGVRAILGIGEGSYYPAGTPLLAAYFPPARRARVLSRWAVGALVGAAVGFLLAAPFASHHTWRYAFFFTGIPGLIFAFLILRVREKTRHEEDPTVATIGAIPAVATGDLAPSETPAVATVNAPSARSRVRAYLRIPTFRTIFGMHALGFFALTSVTSFATIYLNDTYGKVGPTRDKYGTLLNHPGPGPFPHSGLGSALVPILAGGVVLVGGIIGNLYGGTLADRLSRRHSGARVLAGAWGFLLAAPCVLVLVGAPYLLRHLAFYSSLSESSQVLVGVGVFTVFALLSAFFLNLYSGPTAAALLDVVPANERAAAGGTELTLAHLCGDVYAAALVGLLAELFSHAFGGEQIGLAILVTCPPVLVASGIVGIRGSRHYARDVAALGKSASEMLGTATTG